jgi:vesicle-fusing ATPase
MFQSLATYTQSSLTRLGQVHVEIGLPDEAGREQILRIHTADMAKGKLLAAGAEQRLAELAQRTKNFSGAELSGLVRTATASAMDR